MAVKQEVIHASTERRFLDQVRDRLRLNNYACRTEKSYLYWITQYILFRNKRHPNELSRALLYILEETPGATIYGIKDTCRLEERVPPVP